MLSLAVLWSSSISFLAEISQKKKQEQISQGGPLSLAVSWSSHFFLSSFFLYLAFFCLKISVFGRRGEVVEIGVEVVQAYDPSLFFHF